MAHHYFDPEFMRPDVDSNLDAAGSRAASAPMVLEESTPVAGRLNLPPSEPGSRSRELAENELTRLLTTDPGVAREWMEAARMVGVGLLCTSILLAGALLLTLVAALARGVLGIL